MRHLPPTAASPASGVDPIEQHHIVIDQIPYEVPRTAMMALDSGPKEVHKILSFFFKKYFGHPETSLEKLRMLCSASESQLSFSEKNLVRQIGNYLSLIVLN